MTLTGLGDAMYTWVAANNPNFAQLSTAEKNAFKVSLEGMWGVDTNYIQTAADVLPAALSGPSLSNPIGQAVDIPVTGSPGGPSTGATSAAEVITGKGSIT